MQTDLGDAEGLKAEIAKLENERNVAAELVQQLIDQNARVVQNQDDYQRRYDEMFARYVDAEKALTTAQGTARRKSKRNRLRASSPRSNPYRIASPNSAPTTGGTWLKRSRCIGRE